MSLYNFEYFQEDQHNDNDNHHPSDQKAYATDGQFPGALLQGEKHKAGTYIVMKLSFTQCRYIA